MMLHEQDIEQVTFLEGILQNAQAGRKKNGDLVCQVT
jgi:hypothetical protein